jgi:hypothetical protein
MATLNDALASLPGRDVADFPALLWDPLFQNLSDSQVKERANTLLRDCIILTHLQGHNSKALEVITA